MTKEGYTHIIVPKELHARLKVAAEARGMSMASYIDELQSSVQAFVDRVSDGSSINTNGERCASGKSAENCLNRKKKLLRSGFEPESLARKAEMIGRATLPEHEVVRNHNQATGLKIALLTVSLCFASFSLLSTSQIGSMNERENRKVRKERMGEGLP